MKVRSYQTEKQWDLIQFTIMSKPENGWLHINYAMNERNSIHKYFE